MSNATKPALPTNPPTAHCPFCAVGDPRPTCPRPARAPREPLLVRVPTTLMMLLRGEYAGLTQPQRRFLEGAADCTPPSARAVRFGWSGIGAKGPSVRVAQRLEKLGLVEYVSHGHVEDDENGDAEWPIYAVTTKGRNLLKAAEVES